MKNDQTLPSQRQLGAALLFPFRAIDLAHGEAGQAALRVVGGLFAASMYLVCHLSGAFGDLWKGFLGVCAYALFGYLWCVVVALRLGSERQRMILVILLDEIVLGTGLWLAGAQLAAVAWLPIFMSLGNGLRFGIRIALYSSALAALGMAAVFLISPYWQEAKAVALGLVIASFVIPLYGVALARRLELGRRNAEQRALDAEQANRTDSLTGAANRAGFTRALKRALEDSHDFQAPCCVFYLDLDGFKPVNDSAGHLVGDGVLTEVAKTLKQVLRTSDVIGRLGGDEFAIIARGLATWQDAGNLASKIISAIRALAVPGHPELRVSASVGVCMLPDARLRTVEEVLDAADHSMLSVKRSGKGDFRIANVPT